jgi:hypothetical protein
VEGNHTLQTAIFSYYKQRHLAMNVLNRTLEALHTVRAALEHCTEEGGTRDTKEAGQTTGRKASGGWV